MYCPQCGQQQLAGTVRFCARCGFSLEGVSNLLMTGGLTSTPAAYAEEISPRQKGIRLGAKALFAGIVSFPLIVGMAVAVNGPGPLVITFMIMLFGISRMIYAKLFESPGRPQGALPSALPAPVGSMPYSAGMMNTTSATAATATTAAEPISSFLPEGAGGTGGTGSVMR